MKKRILGIFLVLAMLAVSIAGCGTNEVSETAQEGTKDSVIIAMSTTSEPAAGFDPAYGWGAGEHVHEPLIQST